jgi:paraquat-inducible protein A
MAATVPRRAVTIAAAFYYPLAVLLGIVVVINANERSLAMELAANLQTIGSKASYAGNTVLETITFGWYDAASRTDADYDGAVAIADACGRRGALAAWGLAGITAAFCLLAHAAGRAGTAAAARQAARHLCLASLVLFAVGVTATALSLVASKEVAGIGTVVFSFEAKSVASTIRDLLGSHDLVLGGLVLLFSIVVPLAKAGLVLFATAAHGAARDRAVQLVHIVGRWSMADVFVVAVLLAMLALGRDPATRAMTGPGLYCFAGYCVVALWSAAWLPPAHGGGEPRRYGARSNQ